MWGRKESAMAVAVAVAVAGGARVRVWVWGDVDANEWRGVDGSGMESG